MMSLGLPKPHAGVAEHTIMVRRRKTAGSVPPDVTARDFHGRTALHRAARGGNKQRIMELVEAGADVEARTRDGGDTPLHLAVNSPPDLLPFLITPATLNAQNDDGKTALQLIVGARCCWKEEAAKVLVAAGASPAAALFGDSSPHTAFSSVRWQRGVNMILLNALLSAPVAAEVMEEAVRWRGEGGATLLHLAAGCGYQDMVAKLVAAGADRDAVTSDGATPLQRAAAAGNVALVPLLPTPGNINLPAGQDLTTPLLAEAGMGNEQVVAALLAAGASAGVQDARGRSCLRSAAAGGSPKVFALLLAALVKECAQQQQGQQQHEQAKLTAMVVAAVVPHAKHSSSVSRCSQLLELVLDVLGPEVAGEVCTQVQQQLQQRWDERLQKPDPTDRWSLKPEQISYLAEALLQGYLKAEERLFDARQPVLARVQRLQRLVPGIGAEQQQGQEQQQQQQQGAVWVATPHLVQSAAQAAAAAGQQEQAVSLLKQVAAMHLREQQQEQQQQQQLQGRYGVRHHYSLARDCQKSRIHQGLQGAVRALSGPYPKGDPHGWESEDDFAHFQHACSFLPVGTYTTFLAAWVGARRRLQQLPREEASVVVAAVEAAQQQQPQQHEEEEDAEQQQPQPPGPQNGQEGCVACEEERLSSQLSSTL